MRPRGRGSNGRRPVALPRAILPLAVALLAGACNPYAYLTEVGDASPPSSDCGGCHVEIHREWAASTHAESWTRPAFVDATSERRFEACLGCHAPDTVFGGGTPRLRASRREEGVNCVACHLDSGVLAGPAPTSALLEPHPVAAERAIYRTSELCGTCHEGTYREWKAAATAETRTCQDCHMPRVTRTLTQGTDALSDALVAFEDEYEGRRHTFHLDAVDGFEDAVEARLEGGRRDPDRVRGEVVLVDRLPHRVPTGDFGFRRVALELVALDATGQPLATTTAELYADLGTALEPGIDRAFPFDFPGATSAVRARLSRGKASGSTAVLLERRWDLP